MRQMSALCGWETIQKLHITYVKIATEILVVKCIMGLSLKLCPLECHEDELWQCQTQPVTVIVYCLVIMYDV